MSWLQAKWARLISALVLISLAVQGLIPINVPAASARSFATPVPVVFVPEEATTGLLAWGGPALPERSPLWRRLVEDGYEPGRTIFACRGTQEQEEDYVALASRVLRPCLDDALAASGASKVDVVAAGGGALAVRYYARSPSYRGEIRTAVLFSPPNHGSFLAAELASDWFAAHLGFKTPGTINRQLFGDELPEPPSFVTEEQYLKQRVQEFYLPLWFVYVMAEDYLAPASSAGRRSLSEWLADTHPQWVEALWHRASQPPLGLPNLDLVPPAPGQDLSVAYYDYLAMEVAHRLYLRRTGQSQWQSPDLWKLIPDSGKVDRVELVQKLYTLTKDFWDANKQQLLLWAARHLLQSRQGVAWRRLIPESMTLDRPFIANAFLHAWNQAAGSGAGEGPRYVVIAGAAADIWSGTDLGSGRHDWFTDASSMLIPMGREGVFRLFQGLVNTTPWQITGYDPAVDFAAYAIEHYYSVSREHVLGEHARSLWRGRTQVEGSGQASPWEPQYVRVRPSPDAVSGFRVELNLERVPRGYEPMAWVHLMDVGDTAGSTQTIEIDLAAEDNENGWTGRIDNVAVPADGQVLIGWRLRPAAGVSPDIEANLWAPVSYRISVTPRPLQSQGGRETADEGTLPGATGNPATHGSVSGTGGAAPDVAGGTTPRDTIGSGSSDTSNTGGAPSDATGTAADTPPAPAGPAETPLSTAEGADTRQVAVSVGDPRNVGTGEIPIIQVVLTSRLTTDRKPDRTYHSRWEWHWGDGTVSADHDPAHVRSTQTHTYAGPGEYQVEAISYSDKGSVLRRQQFTARVAEAGEPVTLTAVTIQEPRVDLRLEGPEKWITGRPADFRVSVNVGPPPMATRVQVTVYPARHFRVQWAKPGKFTVRAAAVVRVTYDVDGTNLVITNTYVVTKDVDVVTLSLTG